MDLTERTVSHTRPYEGILVRVDVDRVELPNGRTAPREVVRHAGGVAVLPLNEDGTVTVVRQYRYPFGQELVEIPAGKLEAGEQPRAGALRELGEEVGAVPGELVELGCIYPSPGFCDEVLYLYLARKLTYGACHPDEDEFLQLERIPLEQLTQQVMDGTVRDAKTVAAVLKAGLWLARRGKEEP